MCILLVWFVVMDDLFEVGKWYVVMFYKYSYLLLEFKYICFFYENGNVEIY